MIWQIKFTKEADKQFSKLDKFIQKNISAYLKEITEKQNPRKIGKALTKNMKGLWRFRHDDYRMICRIQDKELIILVLKVAHRKEVYS